MKKIKLVLKAFKGGYRPKDPEDTKAEAADRADEKKKKKKEDGEDGVEKAEQLEHKCKDCGDTWTDGKITKCPKCGSKNHNCSDMKKSEEFDKSYKPLGMSFEKSGKKGLTAKKVSVTRGGKTFQQTVYVKTTKDKGETKFRSQKAGGDVVPVGSERFNDYVKDIKDMMKDDKTDSPDKLVAGFKELSAKTKKDIISAIGGKGKGAATLKEHQQVTVNTGGKDSTGTIKGADGKPAIKKMGGQTAYRVEFPNNTAQYMPAEALTPTDGGTGKKIADAAVSAWSSRDKVSFNDSQWLKKNDMAIKQEKEGGWVLYTGRSGNDWESSEAGFKTADDAMKAAKKQAAAGGKANEAKIPSQKELNKQYEDNMSKQDKLYEADKDKEAEALMEEYYDSIDKAGGSIVWADWKDPEEMADQFESAIKKMGGKVATTKEDDADIYGRKITMPNGKTAYVMWDAVNSDIDELADEYSGAIRGAGGTVLDEPSMEGSDTYGFVVYPPKAKAGKKKK